MGPSLIKNKKKIPNNPSIYAAVRRTSPVAKSIDNNQIAFCFRQQNCETGNSSSSSSNNNSSSSSSNGRNNSSLNNNRNKLKSAEAILAQKKLYQKHLRTLQQSSLARDVLQSIWTLLAPPGARPAIYRHIAATIKTPLHQPWLSHTNPPVYHPWEMINQH